MSFITDKQTLDDLHIFGKRKEYSIYNIFNTTQTRGGAQLLEDMFLYPLSEITKINKRSAVIRYFQNCGIDFPFRNELFDTVEYYLSNTDCRTQIIPHENNLQQKIRSYMGTDTEFAMLHKGILAAIGIISGLHDFLAKADTEKMPDIYSGEINHIKEILADKQLTEMLHEKGVKKLTYAKAAEYDHLLRNVVRDNIKKILHFIYQIDVYIAVAHVATKQKFTFAEALPPEMDTLKIREMYHPQIANAVANTLCIDQHNHVIFLTGANMAGKSTFMKTLGLTLFLAHMGFPVPAEKMEFSVRDGMFTTINLPDNLNMGYSHFYAEVLRLKKVAEQLGRSRKLIVIFDELFRGTNVKDAYDATVAVTEAIATNHHCIFMISTHIIEAGETLQKLCDNIDFIYFPTLMENELPKYTYRLKPGITNDRHGMKIINNEHIIDILKSRKNTSN